MSKLEKFVQEAKEFAKKDITASNPDFIAWNNSLIRFMETKYGSNSTTTANFKKRRYSLSVYALGTPESSFINAYKRDMEITLRELEILLNEEKILKMRVLLITQKRVQKIIQKKFLLFMVEMIVKNMNYPIFIRTRIRTYNSARTSE